MDYEKAYKEALEMAKVAALNGHQNLMEGIFPELRESKDERIIKFLKKCVQQPMGTNFLGDINKVDVLAWLEKQGEHANFRNKIQIGDKVTRNEAGILVNISQLNRIAKPRVAKPATIDIDKMVNDYANNKERGNEEFGKPVNCMIRAYRQGLTDAIFNLEKQDEQKPYGQREECLNCQFNYAGECKGSCAIKIREQKYVWSEEDELMLLSIIQSLETTNGAAQMKIDWLKTIKQRIGE